MSIASINSSFIKPGLSKVTEFFSTNWVSFKSTAIKYGTKVSEAKFVQKIVQFVMSFFQSIVSKASDWTKFSWSHGTALTTIAGMLSVIFAIGKWGPTVSSNQ